MLLHAAILSSRVRSKPDKYCSYNIKLMSNLRTLLFYVVPRDVEVLITRNITDAEIFYKCYQENLQKGNLDQSCKDKSISYPGNVVELILVLG